MVSLNPASLGRRDVKRIFLIVLGTVILATAIISPWWTRGMTINSTQNRPDSEREPAIEGQYLNYAPFQTPGGVLGVTSDASRAAAVAILGIALVVCLTFTLLQVGLRVGMRLGWLEENRDLPVRFAIAAFVAGTFAVLWGALFLPLLGVNPGFLWGTEYGSANTQGPDPRMEVTRYANAGFYLGVVGAAAYPLLLWLDAAATRNAAVLAEARKSGTTTPSSTPEPTPTTPAPSSTTRGRAVA